MNNNSKNVFKNEDWHLVTRTLAIFAVAPYMLYASRKNNDDLLLFMGLVLIIFDLVSLFGSGHSYHQMGRFLAFTVQGPYMVYAGRRYKDNALAALGLGVVGIDLYTFALGMRKKTRR